MDFVVHLKLGANPAVTLVEKFEAAKQSKKPAGENILRELRLNNLCIKMREQYD